jgi:hypothetical protein
MSETQELAVGTPELAQDEQELPQGIMYGGTADIYLRDDGDDKPAAPIIELLPHEYDTTVALQGMLVRLPQKPIEVNGSPYNVAVDGERLARAVNLMRSVGVRSFDPRILEIVRGESLPPKFAGGYDDRETPVHNYKQNGLKIMVPKAVVSPGDDPDKLASVVACGLNLDLARGLQENRELKSKLYWDSFKLKVGTFYCCYGR